MSTTAKPKGQAATAGAAAKAATANTPTVNDLQAIVYQEVQSAAAPTAIAFNMPGMLPVNEGSLGDLPWFYQNGTSFNNATYNWLNSLFAYQSDGYVGSNKEALTTAYFNVLEDTSYVLDAADSTSLNNANLKNAAVVNTIITDWTSAFGPLPSGTQISQLNYIMTQVLSWGAAGLTLGQLRNSTNPMGLLPNIPLGASQLVSDLMTYLANTSSVANIQAAVLSCNNQITQTKNNVNPPSAPTVGPGFMQTVDATGNTLIVPEVDITESTGVIQNALLPTSGGTSFSASFSAFAIDSDTVQISSSSGAGVGDIGFFLGFSSEASSSLNIFSADTTQTSCTVTLTYNGVTTFTPTFYPYNVSTGKGWWNPDPIEEAANPTPNQSGYVFNPTPAYNFGVNGNFGVLSRLMISQQPVISLTYTTSNYAAYQKTFAEQSSWGVSFLGIPLGGGSQSYYSCQTSQDASSNTVTVTMSPAGISTPITPTQQLAYVIGAQILWPGASTTQNAAGI